MCLIHVVNICTYLGQDKLVDEEDSRVAVVEDERVPEGLGLVEIRCIVLDHLEQTFVQGERLDRKIMFVRTKNTSFDPR